ncbi:MAG: TolC family protein, partial [Acidobacteriota bacterium]
SWQPPRPDRRRLAVETARAEVTAADARLEARRLDLRLHLRAVYARWALARERAETLSRHAERLAALAERERLRADRGEASGLSVRRLELAAERVRGEADRATAELEHARSAARGWWPDLPAGAEPRLPELPDPDWAPGSAATPPSSHARTRSLEAAVEAARLGGHLTERFVPTPELVAGWQRIDDGVRTVDGPLLGLSWSIPLFDRNRPDRARAEARLTASRARLERTRRELAAELAGARAAYEELHASALALRRAATRTPPMIDAATAAFRLGEADLTDLLDALRSGAETELAAVDLLGEALAAHRDLERAAGRALTTERTDPTALEPDSEGDDR